MQSIWRTYVTEGLPHVPTPSNRMCSLVCNLTASCYCSRLRLFYPAWCGYLLLSAATCHLKIVSTSAFYLLCKLKNQQSPNTLSPKLPIILSAPLGLFPVPLSYLDTQHLSKNSAQADTCQVLTSSEEKLKKKPNNLNKYNKVSGAGKVQSKCWYSAAVLVHLYSQTLSHLSLPCWHESD